MQPWPTLFRTSPVPRRGEERLLRGHGVDVSITLAPSPGRGRSPFFSNHIRQQVEAAGDEMEGLQNRLKSEESMARKLISKSEQYGITPMESAIKLGDALRYTAVYPDEKYASGVVKALATMETKGYKFTEKEIKSYNADYKGLHYSMTTRHRLNFQMRFTHPGRTSILMPFTNPATAITSRISFPAWQAFLKKANP